jgi:hypothetical protein
MTTLAAAMKRGGLLAPMTPSRGIGPDAVAVAERIDEVCQHLWESVTLRRVTELGWIELADAAQEAALPNWDGYGAKKIDPGAYRAAEKFLGTLPTTTPVPDVSVDPDGEVSISWNRDRDWVFSVSVGPNGRLSYAGLFGTSKAYGTEWFTNEIPEAVLDSITRLFAARRHSA